MSYSLDEIHTMLGPPSEYVAHPSDLPLLRQWAALTGYSAMQIAGFSTVHLTNLYVGQIGPGAPDVKPAPGRDDEINEAIVRILNAVNVPGFSADLTRQITAEFIQSPEMRAVYEAAARQVFEALPPRRVEFVTLNGSYVTDGLTHAMTETIARISHLGHAVMMVGPAGCGKTTIAEHVAKILSLPFFITSTINDTHELTGFVDGHGHYHATPFRLAFEHGGVWVADEIDAWDASALLAANSALANGFANFPDNPAPVQRHPNFRMIATANTFGNGADRVYIGRNELDAASLDRFATVNVDYDERLERIFANGQDAWLDHVWKMRSKVNKNRIRHVVSSRAIVMGSAALTAGLPFDTVNEIYLLKGMSEADRAKCK